jgi:long-chain acyl-CoA synthetase
LLNGGLMLLTLTARLQQAAAANLERVALISRVDDSLEEFTYARLIQDCLRLAHRLCRAGIEKGDRIALLMENCPEWCFAYFGVQFAGGVAVPADAQSLPETAASLLSQTRAKILITSAQTPLAPFLELPFLEKIIVVGAPETHDPKVVAWSDLMAAPIAAGPLPAIYPDDLSSIIFTSGTTGPPKGVMLTHKNFCANFLSITRLQVVTAADIFLALLPLHHSFPFMGSLITPLLYGARIVFINSLRADLILRCLQEQEITILIVTPQVLQYFARGITKRLDDLPLGLGAALNLFMNASARLRPTLGFNPATPLLRNVKAAVGRKLRYLISGGARLPADLLRTFDRWGFTVLEGYGLTETAPVVSINPPAAPRIGSVGKPLAGVEVKIRNPDTRGLGEIMVRGDNVMAGYYQEPEATAAVFRDGWFASGDQGYLDRDGYLYVAGRLKDIIVLSSGKNISVEEVNQHYLQAATIKEIQVLADSAEEKLVAVAVPDLEHFRQTGQTDVYGEIKWQLEYLSQKLEPYKRIRDFVITNQELPKTRLGKIKAYEVAAIYREMAGKHYRPRRSALERDLSPVGIRVVEILQNKTGADLIALEDHLELDLGLDSLGLVELLAALEEAFGTRIRQEEFTGIFTVADLIRFLDKEQLRDIGQPRDRSLSWGQILKAPPPPPLLARLNAEDGLLSRAFNVGCYLLLAPLLRLAFRLRVFGRERLGRGGYILCPNHGSFLDGFLVAAAMPRHLRARLYFLGYSNYFEAPMLRRFAKGLHVVPVNSARHLVPAMQSAAHILKRQRIMGIFPEGARSLTGELRTFKKGVAILAQEAGVPLVPVYIRGSYLAWGPNAPYPRPYPIEVIFGREFSAAELAAEGRHIKPEAPTYEAIIQGLRREVLRLKEELAARHTQP